MIEFIRIRNLALISDAELELVEGMNVLTGETGAGKSFILKAINFITGERLSADMVRPGQERAQVEMLVKLPEESLILRRDLLAESGRSRLYINDTLSSQETIRAMRHKILIHTGQHGQQRLLQPTFQNELVETWMQHPELLQQKNTAVQKLKNVLTKKSELLARSQALAERRELLELHLKHIEKVDPQPNEDEELEQHRLALRNSAQTKKHYQRALDLLRGHESGALLDNIAALEHELEILTTYDETLHNDLENIRDQRVTLIDLADRLRRPPDTTFEDDPEAIEARLYELSQLKRKLQKTLPQILAMREEIEENLSFLDACGLDLRQADKAIEVARSALQEILTLCNTERRKAAENFCIALVNELAGLGFSEHVQILPQIETYNLVAGCMEERIRLLWAPNPGQHPQPLDRIASGGELSRFLLAVISLQATALQNSSERPTLIFDEVDAGVGGVTLNRVAERLCALAKQRQMLLITHWPQLASKAERHFHIYKEVIKTETFTRCVQLNAKTRQRELKRMTGLEEES